MLIAGNEQYNSRLVLRLELFRDNLLSFSIEVFIGSSKTVNLSFFFLFLLFDPLNLCRLFSVPDLGDSFGLTFLLNVGLLLTLTSTLEFLVFLLVGGSHSRHC